MSSEIDGGGFVAAAVALPAAAALGAGWLAWTTGKLLIGAGVAVHENVQRRQQALKEAENQRRAVAEAAHSQLVQMCRKVLDARSGAHPAGTGAEEKKIQAWLEKVIATPLPSDTAQLESFTAAGLSTLSRIVTRLDYLKNLTFSFPGEQQTHTMSSLLDSLALAVSAAQVNRTEGMDVAAADPDALERARLIKRLTEVSGRVIAALGFVVESAEKYGISHANEAWFQTHFNGVDKRLASLHSPRVSNAALKAGIRELEEAMDTFDMLVPTMEKQFRKMDLLYPVYQEAAKALGENVQPIHHFKAVRELEDALEYLKQRAEKAKECAAIYRKLGPEGYLCYAWDQELRRLGYRVHNRSELREITDHNPQNGTVEGKKLPFYRWDDRSLTQLYSVSPACDLQLIVHEDGSITMQTIARDGDTDAVVESQKAHCKAQKEIHEALKENWFILYDSEETQSPEVVQTLHSWRSGRHNPWAQRQSSVTPKKEQEKQQQYTKQGS